MKSNIPKAAALITWALLVVAAGCQRTPSPTLLSAQDEAAARRLLVFLEMTQEACEQLAEEELRLGSEAGSLSAVQVFEDQLKVKAAPVVAAKSLVSGAALKVGTAPGELLQWRKEQEAFCLEVLEPPAGWTLENLRATSTAAAHEAAMLRSKLRLMLPQNRFEDDWEREWTEAAQRGEEEVERAQEAAKAAKEAERFRQKQVAWDELQKKQDEARGAAARAQQKVDEERLDEAKRRAAAEQAQGQAEAAQQAEAASRARRAWRNTYANTAPPLSSAINDITNLGIADPKYCESLATATSAFASGGAPPDPDLAVPYRETVSRLGQAVDSCRGRHRDSASMHLGIAIRDLEAIQARVQTW